MHLTTGNCIYYTFIAKLTHSVNIYRAISYTKYRPVKENAFFEIVNFD